MKKSTMSTASCSDSASTEYRRYPSTPSIDILKKYSALNEFVISTGGGAVLSHDNKKILNNGYKIYLKISIDAQYNRVKHRKHRPLLIEGDLKTILKDLDEVRGGIYSDLADLVVDVSYLDKEDVLSTIMNQIEN